MKIYIGADHRGFEMKNKLIEFLIEKNYSVEDCGAYELDITDDYPEITASVVEKMEGDDLGIVLCGSGIGVDIAANRFNGIRSGLGFDEHQVKKGREDDAINVLALAADEITLETAQKLVEVFITTKPLTKDRYVRRQEELDELT
ncbi:hypothetical protein A3D80_02730 [Candidatus Roizmanbacteria bacterium RIFCSPHIGHO2_02_FULL_40_13b]|nr:MAG: hypothetical protein A3D80_02730 [Candidatus Roizmanbacteria bacterium RIFCSPHIGHO2_02_FULL_40_13b]OGK49265.1 MAG: hypothetical protein A3A56_00560 [Candidatus Roizmanbacteria bacterium RIFCSPLOWO2_01_FULL_40_32]